jgi:uncharacterized lipoprotein YddW (UPF0748 family)
LIKVSREEAAAAAKVVRQEQGRAKTLADLISQGKARGMKNPHAWAAHVFKARANA